MYLSDKTYTRWRLPSLLINAIQLVRKADIIVGANEGRATAVSLLLALLFKKDLSVGFMLIGRSLEIALVGA